MTKRVLDICEDERSDEDKVFVLSMGSPSLQLIIP